MLDPTSRPHLQLTNVLDALARHRVRWVMAGSVVLLAHGARFEPGDVDVVPALDDSNLEAVAKLLDELGAIPSHHPDWSECPDLEWHGTWRSTPASVDNLDHLYVTRMGMVDIVPRLCGTYAELLPDAHEVRVGGHEVRLAHPRFILERLDDHRRKDAAREQEIAKVRAEVEGGGALRPDLDWRS